MTTKLALAALLLAAPVAAFAEVQASDAVAEDLSTPTMMDTAGTVMADVSGSEVSATEATATEGASTMKKATEDKAGSMKKDADHSEEHTH